MDISTIVKILVAVSIFALALSGLVVYLWQFKALANRLQSDMTVERERANTSALDAARLPDALQRATDAEALASLRDRELREKSVLAAELSTKLSEANDAREQIKGMYDRTHADLERERTNSSRLQAELAQVAAQRDAVNEHLQQVKSWLDTAKESLRASFVEAASGVFDEKSLLLDQKIKASSDFAKEQVQTALKPFADRVAQFQQQVGDFTEKQRLDSARLGGTISQLMEQNSAMVGATDSLTKALKGSAKARGDWGEMILETVLKASGLEAGKHYTVQASTKDEESGANLRPDVIVSFPDDRQLAVDSKVNLVAWAAYNDSQTPEDQQSALVEHTAALRKHVTELAAKNYPRVIGAQSLDLTVLFVPIEGALAAALATNPTLQQEAWKKGIAFASPNTLMALLKVAERMWVRDQLQKQVGVIGNHASQLLDTITAFLSDFEAIEGRLSALSRSYSDAKNRLFESNQSVVARTKRLIDAGARGKKRLHQSLQPTGGDADDVVPLLGVDTETPHH